MQVPGSADCTAHRASPATHPSDFGPGEMGTEDNVKISVHPVDADLHGKEISVVPFYPRSCRRKEC